MNYKEVFQLAQDKGYNPEYRVDLSPKEQMSQFADHYPSEGRYIDLCLIQKWLRDEHKIEVEVGYTSSNEGTSYRYGYGTIGKMNWIFPRDFKSTYEEALLNGIYEALKLLA